MPVPTDLDGIRLFLLKHIKGVGPALADRIVDEFGLNTWEVIENTPEMLCKLNGISIVKAKKIVSGYKDKIGARDDIIWFTRHAINNSNYIAEIKSHFGSNYQKII